MASQELGQPHIETQSQPMSGQSNGQTSARPPVTAEWIMERHHDQQQLNASMSHQLEAVADQLQVLTGMIKAGAGQRAETSQGVQMNVSANHAAEGGASYQLAPAQNGGSQIVAVRPKHKLPIPSYDGEKKAEFPAFMGMVEAKFKFDFLAMGDTDEERIWCAYGWLNGKASSRMFPWLSSQLHAKQPLTIDCYLDQLSKAFSDPQLQQKAIAKINKLEQKTKPFRDFLHDFEQTLLEAGGWDWSDAVRKGYLKAAINEQLAKQLVSVQEPNSYDDYVALLRMTSDNLEELKRREVNSKDVVKQFGTTTAESMEWEPTRRQVGAGKRPDQPRHRATWVSAEEIQRRKEAQLCLRCADDNHFVGKCRLLPARRPEPGPVPKGGSRFDLARGSRQLGTSGRGFYKKSTTLLSTSIQEGKDYMRSWHDSTSGLVWPGM